MVGTILLSNSDAGGLFKIIQGMPEKFTKSEGYNIPVLIKQGFFIWIPPPDTGEI